MQTKKNSCIRKATPGAWVAGLLLLTAAVLSCSEDDPAGPPPVPVVSGISSLTVSPGDTVTVTGSNFATPARDNKVLFNNPFGYARPFSGGANSLKVVVPDNAATGPVRVVVPDQPEAGVGPDVTVARTVGDAWAFGGTGADYPLQLPYPAANSEYLLVPYSATAGVSHLLDNAYTVTGAESQASPTPATAAVGGRVVVTGRERFDRRLRDDLEELIARSDQTGPFRREARPPRSPQAPAQFRQFYVLNTAVGSTLNPANYDRVTAMLRYDGARCLIYSDVDTLANPGHNLSQSDFNNFGVGFDNQIFPTDSLYFGAPSDIDGNGKVIILVSPVINGLPATDPLWEQDYFIGGFFSPVDLFHPGQSGVPAGTTNEAEIFYVLAADNGQYLPGFTFSRAYVSSENITTIAHEFEHLISFSYRLFTYGLSAAQVAWLEEGMAHMAEDLNGIDSSNKKRVNDYLADPGGTSLEDGRAPLSQRGGIYLFLRYLGDRFGEDIYRRILKSNCIGRPCVENITGENFYETVGDFLATLYLSGKGITSDARYNYTSIDLADYTAVLVLTHSVGGPQVAGTVRRAAGDFHIFANTNATPATFTLEGASNMGLRTMVVRIR